MAPRSERHPVVSSAAADHNKASVTDQAVDVVLHNQLGLARSALAAGDRIND